MNQVQARPLAERRRHDLGPVADEIFGKVPAAVHALPYSAPGKHSVGGIFAAAQWGGPSRGLVPTVVAAMTQPATRLSDRSEAEVLQPKRTQDTACGAPEAG